jgi:hypothetical protein
MFFPSNSFQRTRIIVPLRSKIYPSRRSLQHVREKVRPQLECPPLFRAPVTDGVMFLTGGDTMMTGLFVVVHMYISSTVIQHKISCTPVSEHKIKYVYR